MQTETATRQIPAAEALGNPLKAGAQTPPSTSSGTTAERATSPAATAPAATSPSPAGATRAMTLELLELELSLDPGDIADRGFRDTVRDAARTAGAEFLFDLPASGLVADAQRIAVVCLSRDNGGRFGLVLLSPEGEQAHALEPGPETEGLVQFAKAFVGVLEKL